MVLFIFTEEHEMSYLVEFGINWDILWRMKKIVNFYYIPCQPQQVKMEQLDQDIQANN
jgi:hypothetical protein